MTITKTLTEKLAEVEKEGFEFNRGVAALPFLDEHGIESFGGVQYGPENCPSELRLILVYDKNEPVYMVYKKK